MRGVTHGTTGWRLIGIYLVLYFLFFIFYFYLAPVNWELHLHASRVFFVKEKIKSAKAKIKLAEDRSLELLKLKWKSHLKHCSTKSTRKPQSSMSSIPSQICSHFSILNQNLTLNLRSLRSLYSQSQVSLVSSLKSQPLTDFTPYPSQSKPLLLPPSPHHHTHGFASLSTMG